MRISDWSSDVCASDLLLFVGWKTFGYNMIIFLAALQTVPRELDEAARIDGAGWFTRLRHVTLPAIAPTMLLVSVLTVAGMFQLFAAPYVMRSEERRVGKECVSTCRYRWSPSH